MTDSADERMARALEEMRDLHREHLAIYRELAASQQDALQKQRELQASAGGRLRLALSLIVVVLVLITVLVIFLFRRVV